MEKNEGVLIQMGACSSCNKGSTNENNAERNSIKITEFTVGNIKFRLCCECKKTLRSLCE
jgi:hypothetical protein